MPEPILKWAGGKRQILSQITSCFPPEDQIGSYHEPFLGGGAVFFKETSAYAETVNDLNERLANFYWVVREHPNELIRQNETHEAGDEYYYNARDRFNEVRKATDDFSKQIGARVEEASLLLFLNRTCYNGLYRENSKGEFNVPCGDTGNPNWRQGPRITEASRALEGVKILSEDFEYVTDHADEGDLVYFDPPYKPVSKSSSFVEYTSESFGREEQERLRDLVLDLHDNGVFVVVSNSHAMIERYSGISDIEVVEVGARRSINSDAEKRGEVVEIIITNVETRRAKDTSISQFGQGAE